MGKADVFEIPLVGKTVFLHHSSRRNVRVCRESDDFREVMFAESPFDTGCGEFCGHSLTPILGQKRIEEFSAFEGERPGLDQPTVTDERTILGGSEHPRSIALDLPRGPEALKNVTDLDSWPKAAQGRGDPRVAEKAHDVLDVPGFGPLSSEA